MREKTRSNLSWGQSFMFELFLVSLFPLIVMFEGELLGFVDFSLFVFGQLPLLLVQAQIFLLALVTGG